MWKKKISFEDEAKAKLLAGVNKVGSYVGKTMGPAGQNWIIQQKFKSPQVHNDGVEVARHIFLEDETEDMGAQTLVDIAMNTNDEAGDGTTTSIVIADALITRGFKYTDLAEHTGISPVAVAEDIYKQREIVLESLKKRAVKLKKDDLYKVVSTSLRDWELGKKIADMLNEVGVDGRIAVEENWETKRETTFETVKGMKVLGKSASPYFANTANGKEALWKDALILVTNEKIETFGALTKIVNEMKTKGKIKLVIINGNSEGTACYSKRFVGDLIKARLSTIEMAKRGVQMVEILPIEAPSLTSEELKDISTYINARFIDINASRNVSDMKFEDLGTAKDVAATNDGNIHITGGKGNTEERINELKKQMDLEQDQMFKNKIKNRIASLSASQGLIRVGAPTEAEQTYLKEKVIDAVNAGKAAMEEGVIQGGGVPLKEIAEELGKDSILYEALQAPYKTIQANAGGNLEIKPDILDAVKVTRLAVENALSAGAQIIASCGAIVDTREHIWDKLDQAVEKIAPDPKVDFRNEENRDLGSQMTR